MRRSARAGTAEKEYRRIRAIWRTGWQRVLICGKLAYAFKPLQSKNSSRMAVTPGPQDKGDVHGRTTSKLPAPAQTPAIQ